MIPCKVVIVEGEITGWLRPTGHDPSDSWINLHKAYDEKGVGSNAYCYMVAEEWTDGIILTQTTHMTEQIKFSAYESHRKYIVHIDTFDGEKWTYLYEGEYPQYKKYKELKFSPRLISKLRFAFYSSASDGGKARLYDVQLFLTSSPPLL